VTPQQYQRAKALFESICDLGPDQRAARLSEARRDDSAIADEVQSLLDLQDRDRSFLDHPALPRLDPGVGLSSSFTDGGGDLPQTIGRYRIIRRIGEGGMGTVYLAEQDRPRREVALKVIRPGLTSRESLRRFENEAHALGMLRHPGIAQIHDAGMAEIQIADGRRSTLPFFAMEYLQGATLDEYAAQHKLTTRQRLELIARICDAVQHAHQKGVIHRDLKPANVLVEGAPDGAESTGQPKILDFGVARVTEADPQAATQQTDVGQLIGTLAYMSPEQVSGRSDSLDTRSDVYALGVMAYELLAGRRPFVTAGLSLTDVVQKIREEEPPSPASIEPKLRGDVDTTLRKAMAKEPERRYGSASELAADIRRHLADEPIQARPATAFYQLGRFARRNKPLVVAAGVSVIVLVGATVFSAYQAIAARKASANAQREAAKASEINRFLQEIMTSSDPNKTKGEEVSVISLLEAAGTRLAEGHFGNQPEVLMELHRTIGLSFMTLGRYKESEAQCQSALEIGTKTFGGEDRRLSPILDNLGAALELQNNYEEAERYFREAQSIRVATGTEDNLTTTVFPHGLPCVLYFTGRYAEAEASYRAILAASLRRFGENNQTTAQALSGLGVTLEALSRPDEAIEAHRRAATIYRALFGDMNMSLANCLNNMGNAQQAKPAYADAEKSHREALAIRRKLLKPDHPELAMSLGNLSLILMDEGKLAEAEQMNEESLRIRRAVLPAVHHSTAVTLNNRGEICLRLNRLPEALAAYDEAISIADRAVPKGHMMPIVFRGNRAHCLSRMGRFEEAEREMLAAYEALKKSIGPDHRRVRKLAQYLVELYESAGRPADAEPYRTAAASARG